MVSYNNLLDEHDHCFLWLHLHQAYFVSNFMGKMDRLTALNILRTTRAMSMNFALLILQDVRFLFRMLSILLVLANFYLEKDNSKKWTVLKNQTSVLTRLSYSGVIRVKMFFWNTGYSLRIFRILTNGKLLS